MSIVEQKSNLAKLLATENVTVQHKKVDTASFNPKTRVLTIPIWKKMSSELYDLFLSHEVGHALWTPAEGWHDAVCDKGNNYKGFLNVIEDARIEKKVKRKYPGLQRSYTKGFGEIMDRNLFGIQDMNDINGRPFIDRINIFTKGSYDLPIEFTDEELQIIEEIKKLESWDDVVAMTDRLYTKAKEELEEQEVSLMKMPGMMSNDDDEPEDFDDLEEGDTVFGSDDSDEDEDDSNEEIVGDSDGSADSDYDADADSDEDGDDSEKSDDFDSSHGCTGGDEVIEPTCETDESFRNMEESLVDGDAEENIYADIPKVFLKNIIEKPKEINARITKHYSVLPNNVVSANRELLQPNEWHPQFDRKTLLTDFKKKNDRYIALMAKEFEMKKAATKYAKARLYTSGDIDVNKIYKYKFDDQIFRKLTKLPKGKKHGVILTLDMSGSMSDNMYGSLEQVCILTAFCKRVQIPFRVFGFSSYNSSLDKGEQQFSHNLNELEMGDYAFQMKEFINSDMGAKEYKNAFENLLLVKKSYDEKTWGRGNNRQYLADDFWLGSTPLNHAIVALGTIIPEFKMKNGLDIVNTIFIHDGDSNETRAVITKFEESEDHNGNKKAYPIAKWCGSGVNLYLQDKKARFSVKVGRNRNDTETNGLLLWLKAKTDTQVFGFFVSTKMADAINYRYVSEEGSNWLSWAEGKEVKKLARKQKFVQSFNKGFDSFFILNDSNKLNTDDEDEFEFEVKDKNKINTRNLASQFVKMSSQKSVNRVLATKFVEKIAVKL